MGAYENHHFHIIIKQNVLLLGLLLLVQELLEIAGANIIWTCSSYEEDPL